MAAAWRRIGQQEQGITLVEVLVAMVLVAVGTVAALGSFISSDHTTASAQREQAAMTAAEQEVEQLRQRTFSCLYMATPLPAHTSDGNASGDISGNPTNPDYWVSSSGGSLVIPSSFTKESSSTLSTESMVSAAGSGCSSSGVSSSATVSTAGYTVNLYQFITQLGDSCVYGGKDYCSSSSQQAKRLVVAAVVPKTGLNQGVAKPVWITTIVYNPNA